MAAAEATSSIPPPEQEPAPADSSVTASASTPASASASASAASASASASATKQAHRVDHDEVIVIDGPTSTQDAPAAASVKEAAAWADALDVDDSDLHHNLPSSSVPLRPSTTSHHRPPHRRIPGPASAVQDAMRLRSPFSSVPAVRADGQAADTDFQLDSWLRALQDLGDARGWQQPGIGKIRVDRALDRACRVVGMVTMCTPNGFGDLMLNMKDPSGTIDASVHKKVLSNENISKGLSVGSVIILKQVAVLRPSNTVCYLNVTQKNIEKVLKKDSVTPCKQVVPSSNSERQSQQPGQGDSMEREAGAETSDGMTSILSKISRTKESPMAELLSDNGVNSSILRRNKDTHGVQNHHEKLFEQMDLSSQIQNSPGSSSSQRLQKIIHSMNPANFQVKQGGSAPRCGISSEAQRSTDDVMRKLIGVDTMKPVSKDITVAEGSRHNCGTPDESMDVDARCRSEKPQEIGLQKMVEGHSLGHVSNSNRDERQQQNPSANTRCSQSILGESSVMGPSTDSTQASCTGNLRRL
ncbi:uncharacterized protein LOC124656253 [Lolium rigidum]|uniref:uncharacterized protein LOC124656253 n=1 Tax=Lolium rigidum TaxID=89674 RepID=UPI001F5DC8D1|nr:uncharacterized protein LOC124656253 [Lolium rigidum]